MVCVADLQILEKKNKQEVSPINDSVKYLCPDKHCGLDTCQRKFFPGSDKDADIRAMNFIINMFHSI